MVKPDISQKELQELLEYAPETGVFTWKVSLNSRGRAGSPAGCLNSDGYVCIGIRGKLYVAHRLAFLYMLGNFPEQQADHINGIRTDNRWANLRQLTLKENTQNRRRAPPTNKSSGVLGVTKNAKGLPWRARIKVDGKKVGLGSFATLEEASAAYVEAKRRMHPGCTL